MSGFSSLTAGHLPEELPMEFPDELQERKRELANAALGEAEAAAGLSREDLLALLR